MSDADTTLYGARFAQLYDLFHEAKPYAAEARFIRQQVEPMVAHRDQPRLLDLACGTGSHAIEFSRLGFDVTGVDSSKEMLTLARRKARNAGETIIFRHQDLKRLSLPAANWNVATCLFDSLGYLHSDGSIVKALRQIRRLLVDDGVLVVEVWHAPAMLGGFDPVRIRRVRSSGLEAVRIGETTLRRDLSAAEVRYEVFTRRNGGVWRHFVERHLTRFFTVGDVTRLLETAGFRVAHVFGGYGKRMRPTKSAWHLVVVAEPSRKPGRL